MSLDTVLAVIGLICTVLFAPPIISAAIFRFNFSSAKKLLRLRTDGDICIITTTAIAKAEKQNGGIVGVKRDLVPEGDLSGVASAVAALTHFFRRKTIHLSTSEHVHSKFDKEVLLLGSPAANQYAQRFFEENSFSDNGYFKVDIPNGTITCGKVDVVESFDVRPRANGIPARDFFFIATAPGLGHYQHHRTWAVGGFTTYGTAAAATILFDELLRWPKSYAREARRALLADRGIVFGECNLNHDGLLTDWKIHSSYHRLK